MIAYFEKGVRYYQLSLYQDLLGCWVVSRINGGKISRIHRERIDAFNDKAQATLHFKKLSLYREKKRHYQPIKQKDFAS